VDPRATPWRVLEDEPPAPPADPTERGSRSAVPPAAIAGAAAAILVAIGAFVLAFGSSGAGSVVVDGPASLGPLSSDAAPGGAPIQGSAAPGRLLVVEIVGAVVHPGVFHLAADARVGDLVAAAGGFGARVDTDRAALELNLAASLHDGDQVRVPSRDDRPSQPDGPAVSATAAVRPPGSASKPGNRLRADALPGPPVTVAKIIASRGEPAAAAVDRPSGPASSSARRPSRALKDP
jgi:hypothetical protein